MPKTLSQEAARDVLTDLGRLLSDFQASGAAPRPALVQKAVYLARRLQERASELQDPAERRQQAELDRMIRSPGDKATLVQMTDQAFRSRLPSRSADQLVHILDVQGVPRFFSTLDRTLLRGFQSFGGYLPGVAMPLVKDKMQQESANVVLPAEEEHLSEHLRRRWEEGVRMNVNFLGEALLGEADAERRLEAYLAALARPEIEVISVKISTIYSQVSPLAREHTLGVLCDRLELLYRAAMKHNFQRPDGTEAPKLLYLDMEEYRDMRLTADAFMRTLDRPGLEQARGGIALQAYIPDSFPMQREITAWARNRVAGGGSPVIVRLVKGANMEMERVDASLHGWPQAPYRGKVETDANYKRMLAFGMQTENLDAVRLGIASHNLFTLAYGLVLAAEADSLDRVQFEMLEGMANHQRRALFELSRNLLLYAPACRQDEFLTAIGYLVRRLDENTGRENFLSHAFRLTVDSPEWNALEQTFLSSFDRMDSVSDQPRRLQDRSQAPVPVDPIGSIDGFTNCPDTDWALPQNSAWAERVIAEQASRTVADVPSVVAGEEAPPSEDVRDSIDPSRPDHVVARYSPATAEQADKAVAVADNDPSGWRARSVGERSEALFRVADALEAARGRLLGVMLAEGGKLLSESDPEVSEAVDFCRFYAASAAELHGTDRLSPRGRGAVVVVSPWNFPLAIPCGGVAAALAAGNTVILKPASDTVLVAYELCRCFWDSGVPRESLQFVPCEGGTVGQQLVADERVDTVILTGGTETALRMLSSKPAMRLLAETGGKNATVVTAMSDRELAIKHVLHSAFSHSGQKCSATSLLILESEVFHDSGFRETLVDAVSSLSVGSAWDLHTKVGPLIRPPGGDLERALKDLEDGESWAVRPRLHVDDNPHLVSPGVKWGVQPHSYTHLTEFFGPVLGVMEANDLHEAIDLVNATGYGLTSGLESLDDREHEEWRAGVGAGNLYINRPTTGAIVLRQPFGGMGKSAVGPGIKAGGPNYTAQLMRFDAKVRIDPGLELGDTALDEFCEAVRVEAPLRRVTTNGEIEQLVAAVQSYEEWMAREFAERHDHFRLVGEDNHRLYLPVGEVRLRVHRDDSFFEVFARAVASRTAGCRTVVSLPPETDSAVVRLLEDLTHDWAASIEFVGETDAFLADVVRKGVTDRVRYASPERVPDGVRSAAAEAGEYLADEPVCPHGRVELLWYLREQSVSHSYHRYGNLGARAEEPRAEVV